MDVTLSAADAGLIARRGRKLLARGRITHRQYVLLDCLLWSCRAVGKATARVSYSQLQGRARQARSTIAGGITALVRLGVIQRVKHRLLVVGQNGGRVWKQLPNVYRVMVETESREFSGRTDSKAPDIYMKDFVPSLDAVKTGKILKQIAQQRTTLFQTRWRGDRCVTFPRVS